VGVVLQQVLPALGQRPLGVRRAHRPRGGGQRLGVALERLLRPVIRLLEVDPR
jgi:hypothetical protein